MDSGGVLVRDRHVFGTAGCEIEAVHVFGGYGMMREYPVGRYLRDALVYETGEGTSEIQRSLIARGVLGFRSA